MVGSGRKREVAWVCGDLVLLLKKVIGKFERSLVLFFLQVAGSSPAVLSVFSENRKDMLQIVVIKNTKKSLDCATRAGFMVGTSFHG